jgi:hypothetical protein
MEIGKFSREDSTMPPPTMFTATVPTGRLAMTGRGSSPTMAAVPGFLQHPRGYPLDCRRIWFPRGRRCDADLGLCFFSEHFVRAGTWVELSVPLRHGPQRFSGEVVLVRSAAGGYEIGVWLQSTADAARARLVEHICGLEYRLKQHASPPLRPLSRTQPMRDWIARVTGRVPAMVDSRFV